MQPIDVAAYAAWQEYYAQLSRRVNNPTGQGHNVHDSRYVQAFMHIATYCSEQGYDVRDFVATTLGFVRKDPRYITPKDLLRPEIASLYDNARKKRDNQSKSQYSWNLQEAQVRQMQAMMPHRYTDLYSVLISSWAPFEAWFRVMYPQPVDQDLLKTYGLEAWGILQEQLGLRALMNKLRPDTMRILQEKYGFFGDVTGAIT